MLRGIHQSVAILTVAIAFYAVDFRLMRRYDPLRAYGSSRNWVYTILAVIAALLVIAQPIIWPQLGLYTHVWWGLLVQGIGVTMTIGALALHWWAREHLRQFYAERSSDIQSGQYLVNSGPYAYVRHPMYTSYFILATGIMLINPSLPTLSITIYAFVDFSLATRREEKLLIENVPNYSEYRDLTPRFFPRFHKRT